MKKILSTINQGGVMLSSTACPDFSGKSRFAGKKLNTILFICSLLAFIYCPERAIAQTSFWVNPNNPVLNNGQSGEWDSGIAFLANAVFYNDTFYMFYSGGTNVFANPLSIGLATSTDGLNYTKESLNPIFEADGTGFDAGSVGRSVVVKDESQWLLAYDGFPSTHLGPGSNIGLATSSIPTGPWTRLDDPILTVGSQGEWDDGFIDASSIIQIDSGYVIYYAGGDSTFPNGTTWQIGMAFSEDGLVWNKYDDPTTTLPPYAESDPVLQPSPGSWDDPLLFGCSVLITESGFEMIYDGGPGFGYAVSPDGIHWTKDLMNPVFTPSQDPYAGAAIEIPSVVLYPVNDTLYYYLYYDYGLGGGIGFARDTSDYIVNVESITYSLNNYKLYQNYPNPFNPVTNISYNLPEESIVKLSVYNILGEQVGQIVNEPQFAGKYEVNWNASDNPSGVYIYTLEAISLVGSRQNIISKKMILLK